MGYYAQWNETYAPTDSLRILRDLSARHARLGGHVGLEILDLIEKCDIPALCNYELDYSAPWAVTQLISCRQALAFFSKNESLDIGVDKREAAYAKFVASEVTCRNMNRIFYQHMAGGFDFLPRVARILYAAQRKIYHVLGPVPPISGLRLRYGPGASTDVKREDACPSNKMAAGFSCSEQLLHSGLLPSVLRELPHLTSLSSSSDYEVDGWVTCNVPVQVQSGKLEFVPKNAKTFRSIVVEPVLNSMLQLGIGDYIAGRLKRAGVDITDQTCNARMARDGSFNDDLATLDLSSASDTISKGLVKFLLPDGWYRLLSAARTGTVTYRRKAIDLEKFSSMGNGFTFPLETLIFWALTSCSTMKGGRVSVYGDDIICPRESAADVISTLELCGFSVNREKSFVQGPFRESCGHDYYLGIETRPVYVKQHISVMTLYTLHNFFYRRRDFEAAGWVKEHIPRDFLMYGPDGYGDGHLLGDYRHRQKAQHIERGFSGHLFDTFQLLGRKRSPRYPGDFVSPLYSIYVKGERNIWDAGPSTLQFSKSGYPLWPLPGSSGVKKVSIYTLG